MPTAACRINRESAGRSSILSCCRHVPSGQFGRRRNLAACRDVSFSPSLSHDLPALERYGSMNAHSFPHIAKAPTHRSNWLTLAVLCMAVLIAQVDTCVTNLATKPIGATFQSGVGA